MTAEFETPHSIADGVWEYLRKQLLMGKIYPPGTFLREVELANKLNISRSPVREALKELEKHGLVRTIPRKGAVVLSFSEQDINEIYNVRLSLESLIYEHIVHNKLLLDQNYKWLLDCIDRFKSISAMDDKEEAQLSFFDLDCEFHFYIHDLSGLNWTTDLLRRTYSRLYQVQLRHISRENLSSLSQYHHLIVENLRSGNLEVLRTLSVESYMHSRNYFLTHREEEAEEN